MSRLSAMGLELEDIATEDVVELNALIELAEDRGRPPSHYLAAIPLATELRVAPGTAKLTVRVCAGNCQRYGALDLLDHLVERWGKTKAFAIAPIECLDRCDQGPAVEVLGDHGQLVITPATPAKVDEALDAL